MDFRALTSLHGLCIELLFLPSSWCPSVILGDSDSFSASVVVVVVVLFRDGVLLCSPGWPCSLCSPSLPRAGLQVPTMPALSVSSSISDNHTNSFEWQSFSRPEVKVGN